MSYTLPPHISPATETPPKVKKMIEDREAEAIYLGWEKDQLWTYGSVWFDTMGLSEMMEETHSIGEITEEYIEVISHRPTGFSVMKLYNDRVLQEWVSNV